MTKEKNVFKGNHIFTDYCDSWFVSNSPRLKQSSRAKYHTNIERHIKPYFGYGPLSSITPEKVDGFTRFLLHEKNLSVKTVRDILVLFHAILTYIEKRTRQSFSDIEIIYPKKCRNKIRVLNECEEKTLIRYLAHKMDLYKFGVYVALRTGIRIGEVCALRWEDISVNRLTINICHTVQRISSLDAGTCCKTKVVVGTPKSESSCRTIPLMPDIAALYEQFYCGNSKAFILTGTEQCMEPRKLQRYLKAYLDACDIPGVHFHTLRHTFATRCIEAGFDVKTLSEILGHASINVTMNQYVHPDMDRKRENMSLLKNMIFF